MTKPESFREADTCRSCKHTGSIYIFDNEVLLCQFGDTRDIPNINSYNYLGDLQLEYLKSHEVDDHNTCDKWQTKGGTHEDPN